MLQSAVWRHIQRLLQTRRLHGDWLYGRQYQIFKQQAWGRPDHWRRKTNWSHFWGQYAGWCVDLNQFSDWEASKIRNFVITSITSDNCRTSKRVAITEINPQTQGVMSRWLTIPLRLIDGWVEQVRSADDSITKSGSQQQEWTRARQQETYSEVPGETVEASR